MEGHREGWPRAARCRSALCCSAVLALCGGLYGLPAPAAGPQRYFEVPAGDATVTLNEFGHQADLQVLFNFNLLKGTQTRGVRGNFDASDALAAMLAGTELKFQFVNDRTLTVTAPEKRVSVLKRVWQHLSRPATQSTLHDGLEQVLVAGAADSGTQALLGAHTIQLTRSDIDHSGMTTVQDLLRTLPQVFGGGPSEDTLLIGREASTNSARGAGVNLRGLDAGATLVLIDGRRIAPSGTEGAFEDIANIPLSIVDHIDVLPDGAAARYGADAVAGVINIVTRSKLSGAETLLLLGSVTRGSMAEHQLSQLLGRVWETGHGLLGFEYYQQDALRAADRRQETSNLTPFGGTNFDTPYGSPGTITDGLRFWPLPKGQNGVGLTASGLIPGPPNLYDQYQGATITPSEERWSLFGKADDRLTETLTFSAEGLFTTRQVGSTTAASIPLVLSVPTSNPFYVNPTGGNGPVEVLYGSAADFGPPRADNRVDTGNFSLALSAAAPHEWLAAGFAGYSFETQHQIEHGLIDQSALAAALADPDPATAFNPFGDGSHTNPSTLARIGGSGLYLLNSRLESLSLTASGPLIRLPGGPLQLTAGTEYREQTFSTLFLVPTPPPNYEPRTQFDRRIAAAFVELRIPVLPRDDSWRLPQSLEISAAGRYEHFSDVGGATLPKLGVVWSPLASLNVRGTWTRAVRPPNLPNLDQKSSFSTLQLLPDSASPSGLTEALIRYGTNPELQSEHARTWTLGADFAPPRWPGFSLSLTYFDIRSEGRIDSAEITPDVLERPDLGWLVSRNVSAAQLLDACTHGTFTGVPGTCTAAPVGAIIDNRLRNIALLSTHGLDALLKYARHSAAGRIELSLNGTYLPAYSQANTPASPLLNLVSTQNNPIDLRLRGAALWSRRRLSLAAYVNFDNGYHDTVSVPQRKVDSWTTLDLQLSYEPGAQSSRVLAHTQIAVSVQNVFDTPPPFLNNSVGVAYDQENADLSGRIVSLNVRRRW